MDLVRRLRLNSIAISNWGFCLFGPLILSSNGFYFLFLDSYTSCHFSCTFTCIHCKSVKHACAPWGTSRKSPCEIASRSSSVLVTCFLLSIWARASYKSPSSVREDMDTRKICPAGRMERTTSKQSLKVNILDGTFDTPGVGVFL